MDRTQVNSNPELLTEGLAPLSEQAGDVSGGSLGTSESRTATDPVAAVKLWDLSEQLTGLKIMSK